MKKNFFLLLLSFFLCFTATAQKATKKSIITGRVTSVYNIPVADAIIMIDGKATSVSTNKDGSYKIKVAPSAQMIAVFAANEGVKEEPIAGRSVIDFNLDKGTQSKPEVTVPTNEVIDLSEAKHVKYANFSNMYEVLKTIQGVTVSGSQIFIRGIGTINDATPLFVVDGLIVSSIADISPSTIKSIDLLKGSDAAIYGSRGANGVILIRSTGTGQK
jgi:TonB-dependent SusC/RagA subfamily outer membrane receptor